MQSKYNIIMTKFTKSGNHDSSFTKAAILVLHVKMLLMSSNTSSTASEYTNTVDNSATEEEDEDPNGVEEGGFCSFTTSLPVIYSWIWLDKNPALTSFISQKVPMKVQLDTIRAVRNMEQQLCSTANSNKKHKKQTEAEAVTSLVETIIESWR